MTPGQEEAIATIINGTWSHLVSSGPLFSVTLEIRQLDEGVFCMREFMRTKRSTVLFYSWEAGYDITQQGVTLQQEWQSEGQVGPWQR